MFSLPNRDAFILRPLILFVGCLQTVYIYSECHYFVAAYIKGNPYKLLNSVDSDGKLSLL